LKKEFGCSSGSDRPFQSAASQFKVNFLLETEGSLLTHLPPAGSSLLRRANMPSFAWPSCPGLDYAIHGRLAPINAPLVDGTSWYLLKQIAQRLWYKSFGQVIFESH
jgi:hypothetical protein